MSRLGDPGHGDEYSQIWNHLIEALPFTSAQKVISSLLGSIEWQDGLVYAATARRKIIQEARFLRAFVGPLAPGSQERWEVVSSVTLGQAWPTEVALVLVRWVAGDQRQVEEAALGILIQRCLEIWSVPQYIKYSLLSRHRYMTAVLLLAISLLPPSSDHLRSLSTSRPFLESIGLYIGHTDPSICRCGMLVAEVVASRLGQKLDFGDWDEEGQGREWCRDLRRLSEGFGAWDEGDLDTPVDEQSAVDTQQIVRADHETDSEEKDTKVPPPHLDSDDESLVGYASTAPSSRSNSPTPSELEEIEKDPSLTLGRTTRKVQKPVYLLQLGELLEPGKGNDQTEPARHETALNEGASLIRRKQGYGLELGARELAGLAPPPTNVPHFPSKVLPPKLHQKYIANSDVVGPGPVLRVMEGISRNVIDRTRDATEDKVPQVVREKQLRVRPKLPSGSIQVGEGGGPQAPRRSTFNDLAAEFFVMPLINRFWVHLRDEQTREVRTQYSKTAYKGAGTGLVLNATTLGQYLLTLAVLLHAARHSPAFLAVLAPEAIELAITMGTRPATLSNEDEKETKAGVLASALELTLVALDISRDLDSGKSLGLEHGRLLMAVREWAGRIFETLDRGLLVEEGGGREDERMRKASAGVLLSLEEIGSKWRASMLQF
ncbi:telomere binding protein [Tulasnella sp. 403]|nr:telomere binding protein [Tulasnella sp. 403]